MVKPFRNDKYRIEIRRVHNADSSKHFTTGDKVFDQVNPSGTLREYVQSEVTESFTVYLMENTRNGETLGLLRLRFEYQGALAKDVPSFKKNPSAYLSRVGVKNQFRGTRIGSILVNFFLHVIQREFQENPHLQSLIMYLRCRKRQSRFYVKYGFEVAEEYEDPQWGKSVILIMPLER